MTAMPGSIATFRLSRNTNQVMGSGRSGGGHRSGWRYVVSALSEDQSNEGILLDDYVESTFGYYRGRRAALLGKLRRSPLLDSLLFPGNKPAIWRVPWVGIFHHPPRLPAWFNPVAPLQAVFANDRFQASLPYLRGAVTLSEYAADWLREKLSVPVLALKHPTEFPEKSFTWEAFENNPEKKLVQVGWYLRNYRAIYQVEVPGNFQKVHLAETKPWIQDAWKRTDQFSPHRHRPDVGSVEVVSWLEHSEYDRLLCENIILMEVFDASANNTVVESIARNTPLIVNRHPAVMEYLGEDYPLFYDDIREVKELLRRAPLQSAYEHLRSMDKSDLKIDRFIEIVEGFISNVSQ